MKLMILIIMALLSNTLYAGTTGIIRPNYTLDVYNTTQITVAAIDKQYNTELTQIADMLLKSTSLPTEQNSKQLLEKLGGLLRALKQTGNYAYMGLSPIIYPGGSKIGFSIDVVDKKDEKKILNFLPESRQMLPDPANLIQAWHQYEKLAFNYFFKHQTQEPYKQCPAFHCIFGFELPGLQAFGKRFNDDVPKYKNELIAVLRQDKRELNRAAAAYLLAHLQSADEVVDAVAPSMRDSSSMVRNSVMRVLGGTAMNASVKKFPVEDAIRALSYPAETDRNKALYMLDSITRNPAYALEVKTKGCKAIMTQFRMAQPNLHDEAYNVLLHISHEHYKAADYAAWDQWEVKHCG
jgi:hypothetical protein